MCARHGFHKGQTIVEGAYEQRELTCADRIASAKPYFTQREALFCALVLFLSRVKATA